MKRLSGPVKTLAASVGVLALSLVLTVQPSSAGNEATPAAAKSMGDCVTFLGIGKAGDSCLNIIHGSPDAPGVDVYVDGAKAVENLEFGKATGWVALPAGKHQVQVTATGAAADTAVIDANVELAAGAAYEVAAGGMLSAIAPQINQVDVSETTDGSARVRVVHMSPDAPAVDIAVKGGDVLISNLAFPAASAYLEVPAGKYDLEVRLAGTTTVALDLPGVELGAGTVYSVYAIGLAADGSLTVLPIVAGPAMGTPVSA